MNEEPKKRAERTIIGRKRFWMKLLLATMCSILLIVGISAFYMYDRVDSTIGHLNQSAKLSEKRQNVQTIRDNKPVSVLLLGIDRRADEQGRSDTIIVLTMNPSTNESAMLSIPRDTKTEIVGRGTHDKINHAYAFGGAEMAMNSVEKLLDIKIDYVAEIDMKAFQKVVDMFGGVYVQNDFAFNTNGHSFGTGTIHLNGEKALAYTRMRYDDPRGDFGRQERQRVVISSLVEAGIHNFSLKTFNNTLEVFGEHASTNLTFRDLTALSTDYLKAFRNQEILQIQGDGGKGSDGIYYWNPSQESLSTVQQRLDALIGS